MSGEGPWAANTLGVNVIRHKYAAVIISGVFADPWLMEGPAWRPCPRGDRPTKDLTERAFVADNRSRIDP